MSILEEATRATLQPMIGVFNNLVMYRQDVAQSSLQTVVPDLATSWSWNEDGTELTFPLRQDVKWHDGKPFTAKDVKCTWDLLMGTGSDKLRVNPRKSWYSNVEEVTVRGDHEVTFHLKQPQPALLALLASGWSPVYPCHVTAREMRQRPIGTGPFKFVEFKPNEYIKVTRNPDYWKPGRPYLDGIEYTIMREIAPRNLAFFAGKFDLTTPYGVTIPTLKDFKEQAAAVDLRSDGGQRSPHNADQSACGAVRQPRAAPGHDLESRPQGVRRHHYRWGRPYRGDDAAAPGGCVGNAARRAGDFAGLRLRYREKSY
jgi:peptide/nickel transport system substrate-binding protein